MVLEMYLQGRFLGVGLVGRRVNACVVLLGIAKFPSRRVVLSRVLIRDANTAFQLPETPVLERFARLAVTEDFH